MAGSGKAKKAEKLRWPKNLAEQAQGSPLDRRRPPEARDRRRVAQAVQVGQGRKGRRVAGGAGGVEAGKAVWRGAVCGIAAETFRSAENVQ